MNKTRFQLPPRAETGVDRWVSGAAAPETTDPPASPFRFDMASLLTAQRRNMEAVTAANRVVREVAQAVAQRNLEIMQQAIGGISTHMQTMGYPECPGDRAMRQTEMAIKAYDDATANMRELGTLIQQASTEAMEVLGRRFTEAVDEAKSLARYTASSVQIDEANPAPFWKILRS